MEIFKTNWFVGFVVAGKLNKQDYSHLAEVNEVKPLFGRNWWYWKPKVNSYLYGANTIDFIEIKIFCFLVSISNYNKLNK